MKFEDIIALAKNGYKPGDIKELIALAEENKTVEAKTTPEEPAQPDTAKPADEPQDDTVGSEQTADITVLENKIKELEGKLQEAQKVNLNQASEPAKEESAENILSDYLTAAFGVTVRPQFDE